MKAIIAALLLAATSSHAADNRIQVLNSASIKLSSNAVRNDIDMTMATRLLCVAGYKVFIVGPPSLDAPVVMIQLKKAVRDSEVPVKCEE